jgi:diguanylate cyclase
MSRTINSKQISRKRTLHFTIGQRIASNTECELTAIDWLRMISFLSDELGTPVLDLFSRLSAYPSNLAQNELVAGRIRAEQVSNVKRYLFSVMAANAFNALIFVAAVWQSPQRQMAIAWAATVLMFTIYHGFKSQRSDGLSPSHVSGRAIMRAIRNALLLGSLWAVPPIVFFADATATGRIVIACLCAGMLGGATFALSSIPAAALAFTMPILIASGIAIVRADDFAYLLVGLLMLSYVAVLLRGGFVHAAQIARRVGAQAQAESKVRVDELTGLPNRFAFREGLAGAFARLARMDEQFAVVYIDLDDFKHVNDNLGHAVGDKLLVEVGRRLKACAREIDLVARLGGDEFAIVMANVSRLEEVTILSDRITGCLDSPFLIDGVEVSTGACVGTAMAPADGDTPKVLLKKADDALYAAKAAKARVHDDVTLDAHTKLPRRKSRRPPRAGANRRGQARPTLRLH